MAASLTHIFLNVILPVLMVMALGVLLQRKLPMHIPTLARLNIYLFVPAFLFVKVSRSELDWLQIGGIVGGVLIPMALVALPMVLIMRARRIETATVGSMVIGTVIYNAGNFGIPIAELMYNVQGVRLAGMGQPSDGLAVQALVVMMSNISIWCIGYVIIALAKGEGVKGALGYFKLPMIYVIAAALIVKETQYQPPPFIIYPLDLLAAAIVPVSMITLGAQLATRFRWPKPGVVGPVVVGKLLVFPAVTFGVVWAMGLWPWPGAQLVIAAAAPTAVNTLLITVELDGDADLAAECVFWTTVLSAITVTVVLALVVSQVGVAGEL